MDFCSYQIRSQILEYFGKNLYLIYLGIFIKDRVFNLLNFFIILLAIKCNKTEQTILNYFKKNHKGRLTQHIPKNLLFGHLRDFSSQS